MLAATTVLSRFAHRLLGRGAPRRRRRRCDLRRRGFAPVYRAAEVLEERSLLSASFGSVVGIDASTVDVATDQAGNSIMVGSFSGTVDFDPGATHAGDTDILTANRSSAYVAKYDADGSLLWASPGVMVDAPGSTSRAASVTTDASGNVYIGGSFSGTVSFGAYTLTSGGSYDGFVVKLGSDGTVQWATRWGGADSESANGVAVDGAGNVLAAGSTTRRNADGSVAFTNIQVEKFNASGSLVWGKQIGNTSGGNEVANGIGADAAGNVYVGGTFKGTVDFDPGNGKKNVTGGANDSGYVLKLTSAGNFGWVSPFVNKTSVSYNRCYDLAVDGSGNIVVGGSYVGAVDFDPGKGTRTLPFDVYSGATFGGGFISKLNSSGSLIWAQPVGEGFAAVKSLTLDSAGNVYATGVFQGADTGVTAPSDFDPGAGTNILTCNGWLDVFVTRFNANGTYQWAVAVGGTSFDFGTGIAVDGAGNVYVVGSYMDTVDFDPDPVSTYTLTDGGGFRLKLVQV
ncbi:MAG: SBBP repeat-containing protein [Planctomycetaceae bacterium]